jgi:hypothetical protein
MRNLHFCLLPHAKFSKNVSHKRGNFCVHFTSVKEAHKI